jgi:hypothetical protein
VGNEAPFRPFPDPGVVPTKPPPQEGDHITIRVDGYPPYEGGKRSLRSPKNPLYQRFLDLRRAATVAMDGRSWYDGEVQLKVTFFFPGRKWPDKLVDDRELYYFSGIMDTIDGSHGKSFTYLPIVIQDDAQVRLGEWEVVDSNYPHYEVEVVFSGSSGFS